MDLLLILVLLIVGIALIVKGGDVFVDAASWIAEATGIPKFIVGATVVSFATTLPELLVSLLAAAEGSVEMAAGNAIGSVTCNVGLIMGISLLFMPAAITRSQFAPKALLMTAASILLFFVSFRGEIKLWGAAVMFLLFAVFVAENIYSAKKQIAEATERPEEKPAAKDYAKQLLLLVIGAVAIVLGAQLLVDNGTALAEMLGVPEGIIGVTIIAVGTSLPELVTTITAIVKKQSSLSIGNIIGANIIDLSVILPACSFVSGGALPVKAQTLTLDLPFCIAVIALAVLPTLLFKKLQRWQGAALLAVYAVYLVILCMSL